LPFSGSTIEPLLKTHRLALDAISIPAFQRLAVLISFFVNLLHTLIPPPCSTIFPRRRPPERPDPVLQAIELVSVQEGDFSGDREEYDVFELLPRVSEELLCAAVPGALAFPDVPGGHFAVECVEEDEAAIV
jgi:hypothetical protein